MPDQSTYWVIFLVASYAIMFVLVPPKQVRELLPFGLLLGLVQALVILWFGQTHFKVFRLVGDSTLFGIPLITALLWVPPVILFAKFFPLANTFSRKIGYILFFAIGTALCQYILSLLGMWVNLRWNTFYTFLLAIVTHSKMTAYLLLRHKRAALSGD